MNDGDPSEEYTFDDVDEDALEAVGLTRDDLVSQLESAGNKADYPEVPGDVWLASPEDAITYAEEHGYDPEPFMEHKYRKNTVRANMLPLPEDQRETVYEIIEQDTRWLLKHSDDYSL